MSLLRGVMNEGKSFHKVHVREIRANVNNFYAHVEEEDESDYVKDMAEQIELYGQDSNAVVYEDTSVDDGKKYTLLAGERRWKAISYNFENRIGDGMIQVKIINKPENETMELIRIISNNAQRNKSNKVRKAEIDALEFCWNDLVEQNKKPQGKKRDWIAKNIGMSPRQVQEYLTGEFAEVEHANEGETETGELPEDYEVTEVERGFTSSDLETLKQIGKNLSETLDLKVKISKKGAITFQPVIKENMDEVYSLLDKLGFDAEGYYK